MSHIHVRTSYDGNRFFIELDIKKIENLNVRYPMVSEIDAKNPENSGQSIRCHFHTKIRFTSKESNWTILFQRLCQYRRHAGRWGILHPPFCINEFQKFIWKDLKGKRRFVNVQVNGYPEGRTVIEGMLINIAPIYIYIYSPQDRI